MKKGKKQSIDDALCLICAAATSPMMALGSALDRCCSRCGRLVMMAPSGQRRIAAHKGRVAFLCLDCVTERELQCAVLGPLKDILDEMATAVPNPGMSRN
jgi:hypothetical protein